MTIVEGTQFGRVGAFKFWCQKVLPAVYDDSLSYYELLCKVVDYLNKVIELTNSQSDAIIELETVLQNFLDGDVNPYIEEKIDEWFDDNEPDIIADIAQLQTDVTALTGINGFEYAKVEIFHDDTTVRLNANTWDYLGNTIFKHWTMRTHNAGQAGWTRVNSDGLDAYSYLADEVQNDAVLTQEYRESVNIVILQFGFYDMYGTYTQTTTDFETRGRQIVNRARNYFPKAVVCVYPLTDKCFGTSRADQLNFYQLEYGMIRSQVPIYMTPWEVALICNKMQVNHYQDSTNPNPEVMDSGGTNTIAAMIKNSLFGGTWTRETRKAITNAANGTWTSVEFFLDNSLIRVSTTAGRFVPNTTIQDDDVIGSIQTKMFVPTDMPQVIGLFMYNGASSFQIMGYAVLFTDGRIQYRCTDGKNPENLISGRTYRYMPAGYYNASFEDVTLYSA